MKTMKIIDAARIGTRGYPRHWRQLGLEPPMKTVPVLEDGQPDQTHRGLTAAEIAAAEREERKAERKRKRRTEQPTYGPPPLSRGELLEAIRRAVQHHIDETARGRGYDSGTALASYERSTVPQWAAEATAFIAWRDAVWTHVLAEMEKTELPAAEAIIAELPQIEWPALAA